MPVFRLNKRIVFPDPNLADESGLLAVGGDLSAQRLIAGYSLGVFPWYDDSSPILWHSPDPRMVLDIKDFRVPRSLAKFIRRGEYSVRYDTAFDEVISACARVPRHDQNGTWITDEMLDAYLNLFEIGYAHSVESWWQGELIGGLYGVSLGGAFFGESMFTLRAEGSKVAFAHLVERLRGWEFDFVDCQVHTDHVARFGARERPRTAYLRALQQAMAKPTRRGKWTID